MNSMTREEKELFLVNEDIYYIMQTSTGKEMLHDILLQGMKGYMDFTDQELDIEFDQRQEMAA